MPRLRQVPRADADPEVARPLYDFIFGDRDPVAEPGTATGTRGNFWTVFALVPDALQHAVQGFQFYRSADRVLDPVLRELAQARVGWAVGSQFVYSQHCKALRGLGVSDARIAAVPGWAAADCFDTSERAVLAYADCLALDRGRTPDGVFAALKAQLSDEAILELTYIVGLYAMHAAMARALRLEFDDRDEPVVEVAAPAGFDPRDMGRPARRDR